MSDAMMLYLEAKVELNLNYVKNLINILEISSDLQIVELIKERIDNTIDEILDVVKTLKESRKGVQI